MRNKFLVAAGLSILCAMPHAQEIQYLAGDELKQFLLEKPLAVTRVRDDALFRLRFKPDGTMFENTAPGKKNAYITGKWQLNDKGVKVCIKWDDQSTGNDGCFGFYRHGEEIIMFTGPKKSLAPFGKVRQE